MNTTTHLLALVLAGAACAPACDPGDTALTASEDTCVTRGACLDVDDLVASDASDASAAPDTAGPAGSWPFEIRTATTHYDPGWWQTTIALTSAEGALACAVKTGDTPGQRAEVIRFEVIEVPDEGECGKLSSTQFWATHTSYDDTGAEIETRNATAIATMGSPGPGSTCRLDVEVSFDGAISRVALLVPFGESCGPVQFAQ